MQPLPTRNWEDILGKIDRRLVYIGLFLFTLAPLVGRWALPLNTTEPTKMLKKAFDGLPQDKVVLIASDWDAGTQAESRPQLTAVVRYLLRKKLKFILFSVTTPTSPQLGQTVVERAIEAEGMKDTWQYGTHWANMGYRIANAPWLRNFARSIQDAMKNDWKGVPLAKLDVTRGVDKFGPEGQVSMLVDVTGSSSIDNWYAYLSPSKVTIGLACTGVMAPEQYPFLDSGQLSGLLTGMKGAAEFEQLTEQKGFALAAMAGQSFAHLYIFIMLVLGNLSVILGTMKKRARG